MEQADISKVRASVHQQCGNRVKIQLDRGRNKVDIQEGVIQEAYPSVFTVLTAITISSRRVSRTSVSLLIFTAVPLRQLTISVLFTFPAA